LVEGDEAYLGEVAQGHGLGKLPDGWLLESLEEGESRVLNGPGDAVGVCVCGEAQRAVHQVVVEANLVVLVLRELVPR